MFLGFFFALRGRGIAVGPTEWLGVCEVLRHHPRPSLDVLYSTARALCVKHETLYDRYDEAFADAFGDAGLAPARAATDTERFLQGLTDFSGDSLRALGIELPPELLAMLYEHRDAVLRMVAEAERDIEGPIRTEGEGGRESALLVARKRRFRNYRSDVVLDTRSLRVALGRLRRMLPDGPADELDLEATIRETSRNGGEIDLVFRRPKRNRVRLVLLMDAGGTMTPHATLVNRLFSAVAGQVRDLRAYYFHNCPYQQVYADIERRVPVETEELLRLGEDHWLVAVGDAHMNPRELLWPKGAIEGPANADPGVIWLQRLQTAFSRSVWLNPVLGAERLLSGQSAQIVGNIFAMYPLSLDGLDQAMRHLTQGGRPGRRASAA